MKYIYIYIYIYSDVFCLEKLHILYRPISTVLKLYFNNQYSSSSYMTIEIYILITNKDYFIHLTHKS